MTMYLSPKTLFVTFLLTLFSFIPVKSLNADIVVLKNGKTFEGIIKKETDNEVTINIGLGTVSFNRSQVARVKRTKTDKLQNKWQRRYATQGKFVPPELKDFAAEFSELESSRRTAQQAKSSITSIQRKRPELFEQLTGIQNEISNIAKQFQSIDPDSNVQRYNSLVKRQNHIVSRSVIIKNSLVRDNDSADQHREKIAAYLSQLSAFENHLASVKSEYSDPPRDENVAVFFNSIDEQLKDFSTEFQSIEVAHEGQQDHMLLDVRINNKISGRFLLDTGATYVTLSNDIAQRLNLSFSGKNQIPVSLANGTKVNAQPVILESMQVGNAKASGVIAMVFPEAPNDGIDGLLGMSFLREFIIHLDPANKKLVFKKFNPDL